MVTARPRLLCREIYKLYNFVMNPFILRYNIPFYQLTFPKFNSPVFQVKQGTEETCIRVLF